MVDCLVVWCKSYICVYINEGYDVIIVEEMKMVLLFNGGFDGVWVIVGSFSLVFSD